MSRRYVSNRRHVPDDIKPYNHWVLWGVDGQGRKRPLAPWIRGDLYPAKWGQDAPKRPETDWETAHRYWRNREAYSAPNGIDVDDILPAPLLLHDPIDPPLMQVDFDDVRDPDTGEVTDEVHDIVETLGGYCEISQSGEGLHVFVRAELPGGLGKFIAPLADKGEIELYDHGRAVGATWNQVEESPTEVPNCQDKVENIIKSYETAAQRRRRTGASRGKEARETDVDNKHSNNTTNSRSQYFDIDIRNVADTGYFRRYREEAPSNNWEGPHPEHGPINSDPSDCTNFGVVPRDNIWHCFAHDSGGRAIELAAILCPHTDIRCDDVPRKSARKGWLRDRPKDLLRTCVWLRDQGVVSEDERPPYDALVAVAEVADLHIRDEEEGILGEANAEIAGAVFSDIDADQIN